MICGSAGNAGTLLGSGELLEGAIRLLEAAVLLWAECVMGSTPWWLLQRHLKGEKSTYEGKAKEEEKK